MPVLKIKQDGVWKEIAGGSSGSGTQSNLMIVNCNADTKEADHTSDEIYAHVQNGGDVILNTSFGYLTPTYMSKHHVISSYANTDGEIFFYTIDSDGSYILREGAYATGDVITMLDTAVSQKSQVQIVRWEEND